MFSVWDKTWDEVHKKKEWGRYPPEELVRFIGNCGYFNLKEEERKKIKVLDIGCGAGAASLFLARENFTTFAFDASLFALKRLEERLKKYDLHLYYLAADLIAFPFLSGSVDLITDVGAICNHRLIFAQKIIEECYRVLAPKGKIFSMLTRRGSWGEDTGEKLEEHTYTAIKEGPFANLGTIHFFSEEEVINLFSSFLELNIEYSLRTLQNRTKEVSFWVVSATKP
jgi:SAM-dependent methyltransferase